jgi:hypothetical protein
MERRHGEPPCVCTDAGEDPRCPVHGYEAVIRRLRDENDELRELLDAMREECGAT